MRIVRVLVVGIILIFTVSLGWWVSQPVVIGVSRGINASVTDARGRTAMTAIEYGSYAWGPLIDVFILLWMITSAGKRDVESELYG